MCNDDYFGHEFKRSVKCFLERIEKYYHVLINFCIFLSVFEIFGRKSCSVHSFPICNKKKKSIMNFSVRNFNLVSILLRGQNQDIFRIFFFFLINGKTDENNRVKIRILMPHTSFQDTRFSFLVFRQGRFEGEAMFHSPD